MSGTALKKEVNLVFNLVYFRVIHFSLLYVFICVWLYVRLCVCDYVSICVSAHIRSFMCEYIFLYS